MDTGVLNTSDGNAVKTARIWTSGVNVDAATVAATTSYTGAGFQPTHGVFMCVKDTFQSAGWGYTDGTGTGDDGWASNYLGVSDDYGRLSESIIYNHGINIWLLGAVTWDIDGFTVAWTRLGLPTGTIQVRWVLYR